MSGISGEHAALQASVGPHNHGPAEAGHYGNDEDDRTTENSGRVRLQPDPWRRRDFGLAIRGFDEAFEQRAELTGAEEIFRVPLDAEAEGERRIFDRFDDAVGRRCG